MSAGLGTEGSDAVNAPALAGGKGDAQMGAQVCPLHTHCFYSVWAVRLSWGDISFIEFKDPKCLSGSVQP